MGDLTLQIGLAGSGTRRSEKVLTPVAGTIVRLPSGKTAVTHGCGYERLNAKIKKAEAKDNIIEKDIKGIKAKRTTKYVTYSLQEIIEIYDNHIRRNQ